MEWKIEFLDQKLKFYNYPFKPSIAFNKSYIDAIEISGICIDTFPVSIVVKDDIIFVPKNNEEQLKKFAYKNNVKLVKRNSNWDHITEPFLDTQFDKDHEERTKKYLSQNGISEKELHELRKEIEHPIMAYNSIVWEWINLGLYDYESKIKQ